MKIAIMGTGISGVTLALRLQQLGVATTLWSDVTPDETRAGRLQNLVARFSATRDRERLLGVAHWADVDASLSRGIDVSVLGTPLRFCGRMAQPVQAVDFRMYLSRLAEDYAARGGELRIGPLPATEAELRVATAGRDVVVVAAGREAKVGRELFAVRSDRSPFATPQRRLLAGLCTGLAPLDLPVVSFNLVPGAGEIFSQPIVTSGGVVTSFLVEAIPGSPLEAITHHDLADLDGLGTALGALLAEHAPALGERIEPGGISPLGPRDVLSGAITPAVRQNAAQLGDGRMALAIGDAWVVNDPVLGQGANIGSHCAWALAQILAADPAVDMALGQRVEEELWAFAGPVTQLNNAFLQPPPAHVIELLGAATGDASVADTFVAGFADPLWLAHTLLNPLATGNLMHAVAA